MKDYVVSDIKKKLKQTTCNHSAMRIEIRHHKYKRCLAMWMWCKEAYWRCPEYKERFYTKWTDKWRELAEKFKEAK